MTELEKRMIDCEALKMNRYDYYKEYRQLIYSAYFKEYDNSICILELYYVHTVHATYDTNQYNLYVKLVNEPEGRYINKESKTTDYYRTFDRINDAVKYINNLIGQWYYNDVTEEEEQQLRAINWMHQQQTIEEIELNELEFKTQQYIERQKRKETLTTLYEEAAKKQEGG